MRTHRHGARDRRRLKVGVAAACLALLYPTSAAGVQRTPPGALAGVVADSGTGMGLAGVEIVVDGTSLRTVTDARGGFRFPEGSAGRRTLHLRRLGFRPLTVTVGAEDRVEPVSVRLVPSVQYLAPVQVRAERTRYSGRLAGYYERLERRTQGVFISRADLERERPAQLTDMLQRSPGIRVTRGRPGAQSIRMRGRECRPLVWLDGAPMSASDVDLDSFSPASLEGIELYLGANNAPARYQAARGQSECGTILLWSRATENEARVAERGVTPDRLESLIASLTVYASEEVDTPAKLDSAGGWAVAYPPSLRASGVGGTVLAEFVVDTLGRVERENFGIVSSTDPLFGAAVQDAIEGGLFTPAIKAGRKVRQVVRQPFDFRPPPAHP